MSVERGHVAADGGIVPDQRDPLMRVLPDDAGYHERARAEAEHWSHPQVYTGDTLALARPGPLTRYNNRRFTGDPDKQWFEVIPNLGSFRRGLVLGSGGIWQEEQILRTNPSLHATFCDIDGQGLAERQRRFEALFPGRVDTSLVDLNFAALPENAFDLVVSISTLHHITNLEYLAQQVNRTLTPDGTFVLYDYVGASGFRYPREQRAVFEAIYERERRRRPQAKLPDIAWRDVDSREYSPFEAIRAAETLGILRGTLEEVDVRLSGTIVAMLLFAGITGDAKIVLPKKPETRAGRIAATVRDLPTRVFGARRDVLPWERWLSKECLAEFTLVDEVLTEAGWGHPGSAFGIYRKRRT